MTPVATCLIAFWHMETGNTVKHNFYFGIGRAKLQPSVNNINTEINQASCQQATSGYYLGAPSEPSWVNYHRRPPSSGSFQQGNATKLQLSQTPGHDDEFTAHQRWHSSVVVFPTPWWICAMRREQLSWRHTVWGDMTTEFTLTVTDQSDYFPSVMVQKQNNQNWREGAGFLEV